MSEQNQNQKPAPEGESLKYRDPQTDETFAAGGIDPASVSEGAYRAAQQSIRRMNIRSQPIGVPGSQPGLPENAPQAVGETFDPALSGAYIRGLGTGLGVGIVIGGALVMLVNTRSNGVEKPADPK